MQEDNLKTKRRKFSKWSEIMDKRREGCRVEFTIMGRMTWNRKFYLGAIDKN